MLEGTSARGRAFSIRKKIGTCWPPAGGKKSATISLVLVRAPPARAPKSRLMAGLRHLPLPNLCCVTKPSQDEALSYFEPLANDPLGRVLAASCEGGPFEVKWGVG